MVIIKTAKEIFNERAEAYEARNMNVDLYADTLDLFCAHIIKAGASVLEIACGPGNITRYLLNKRPDLQILGTDVAENMLALARKNNPEATFELMDCRELNKINRKFDAVMCGFCLPYLSKEETKKLISDVSGVLNAGGVFYLSTMEDDPANSGYKLSSTKDTQTYINYYEADDLTKMLEENGFNIITVRHQAFPELDGTTSTDLVIIAKK